MRAITPLSLLAALALVGCTQEPASDDKPGGDDGVEDGGGDPGDDTGDVDDVDPVVDADGDGVSAELDCDDEDAAVFPGADEVCDGIDNDCDGAIDVGATDAATWYADADGDGHGDPDAAEEACEAPEGAVANADDCDDADAAVSPETRWYADGDGDGYGDPAAETQSCEAPEAAVSNADDCDDTDATASPETVHYADLDGDGYGDAAAMSIQCEAPEATSRVDGDCDDADAALSPETPWYADTDGDGYGDPSALTAQCEAPADHVSNADDCDDVDAARSPETSWYDDKDGDGYGTPDGMVQSCTEPADVSANADDCNDLDASLNPTTAWYVDSDGDSYGDPSSLVNQCEAPASGVRSAGDCDDGDAALSPDTVWYADADSDGFGSATATLSQCAQPSGYLADASDCDDGAADSYPGAPEQCDGVDHDCDGDGYDSESTDALIWYRDVDGDGFGRLTGLPTPACTQPSGFVADNTDCVDNDGTAYPDSHWTETPNDGVDQDCDGLDVCTDLDCDGYADIVFANWRENGSTYTTDSYIYTGADTGYSWIDRTSMATTAAFAADVADYDQDGYLDVVLATFLPSDYTTDSAVFWGSGSGHDASDSAALDTTGARSVCSGDFDADGYPDALFPSFVDSGGSFDVDSVVHYGSSTGFVDSSALSTIGAFDCVVGDLDGDGYDDAVIISNTVDDTDPTVRYDTTSSIFWGASGGLSDADVTDLTTYGARRVSIEDLDQDGWDDLVIAHNKVNTGVTTDDDEAYTMVFWSNEGAFDDADATELLTWGGYDTAVGDFDGDGYNDIAVAGWTGASGGTSGSTIFWGSTTGWSVSDSTNVDSSFTVWVSAEDFDQDGYDDLVFSNYKATNTETDSYVYYGSATGVSSSDREALPTLGSRRHTVADVNADGWQDVVFANFFDPTTANRADSVVYYGSSTGFDATDNDALPTFGTRWAPIVVGD